MRAVLAADPHPSLEPSVAPTSPRRLTERSSPVGMTARARRLRRPLGRLQRELRDGLANRGRVPLTRQVQIWRHGFYGNHSQMYDFDRFGFDAYLSDLQRATKLEPLNDRVQRDLLNDKLVTFLFLRSVEAPTPEVFGFVNGQRPVFYGEPARSGGLAALLEQRGKLVVKPRGASGGDRFMLLARDGDRTLVNGRETDDLDACLHGRLVISEFVEQHEYARKVFPGATNTLRLLTLRDRDSGEPFVAGAVHRFGTTASAPVDNTRKGGLPARVDVQTGVLGPLAGMPGYFYPGPGPVQWFDSHPDTGEPVRGLQVPHWQRIVHGIEQLMVTMEGMNCVGWDVAVTADGFSILEGNNRPDVIMQAHRPLLVDERTRRFFKDHGVVGTPSRGERLLPALRQSLHLPTR